MTAMYELHVRIYIVYIRPVAVLGWLILFVLLSSLCVFPLHQIYSKLVQKTKG